MTGAAAPQVTLNETDGNVLRDGPLYFDGWWWGEHKLLKTSRARGAMEKIVEVFLTIQVLYFMLKTYF